MPVEHPFAERLEFVGFAAGCMPLTFWLRHNFLIYRINGMSFGFLRLPWWQTRWSQWKRRRLLVGVFLCGMLLWTGGVHTVDAQSLNLTVHSHSQFWIQGEATTHDFTCRVARVEGQATLPADQDSIPSDSDETKTEVRVRVPVKAFDCGNSRMTRDLKETLKIEKHPDIRFELVHATVGGPVDTSGEWRSLHVLGTLTIAGTKRLVRLEAVGHALDEHRFRVRGCNSLRMTYFNIDPPTKAFGLIKVKNQIEVKFDLLAHVNSETSDSPFELVSVDQAPSCSGGTPPTL